MKRIFAVCLALPLTVAALPLSCPSVLADVPTDSSQAQSLISASGARPTSDQAAEQTSPLVNELIGHWSTDNGTIHYYFSPNEVIVVNLLQRQDRSIASHKQKLTYEILSANEAANVVQVHIETPLGWAQVRRLRLADDGQTLLETVNVMGHSFSNEWTYVDDRQQP
jgi:hypothetical protein